MPPVIPSSNDPAGGISGVVAELANAQPQALGGVHPVAYVQVETSNNGWVNGGAFKIDWQEIVRSMDGTDSTARFVIQGLDAPRAYRASSPRVNWPTIFEYIRADRRLRIVGQWGQADFTVLFQGWPLLRTLSWSDTSQSVVFTAISEGQDRMRAGPEAHHVIGRHMRTRPWEDWQQESGPEQSKAIPTQPTVFNAGGRGNRTAEVFPYSLDGELYDLALFVEDDAEEGELWTYGQALRYLAFHYIANTASPVSAIEFLVDTADIANAIPGQSATDPLRQLLNKAVPDLSVESLSIDEAIRTVCLRAGVHYNWEIKQPQAQGPPSATYMLRVFATISNAAEDAATDPGGTAMMLPPVARDITLDPPFTDQSSKTDAEIADDNKYVTGGVVSDARGFNDLVSLGGPTRIEGGVILRPGWFPTQYLEGVNRSTAGQLVGPLPEHEVYFDEAIEFWEEQFDPEYARDANGNQTRIPNSIYHALHPRHGSADDPNPMLLETAQGDATQYPASPVADIFRKWIFPDSHRYMVPVRGITEAYARRSDGDHAHWDASWYEPFDRDNGDISIFASLTKGAGFPIGAVERWVPRYRPFENLIGRRNLSSSDQSPIVLVNFQDTNLLDAANGLADPPATSKWVQFAGHVVIDQKQGFIRFAEGNIWNGHPFLADPDLGTIASEKAMELFMRGQFWVAILASWTGFARLRNKITFSWGLTRNRTRVQDYGLTRFVRNVRGSGAGTILDHVDEFDPQYQGRSDTQALLRQAQSDGRSIARVTTSGDVETFFIYDVPRVGDSFTGITGQSLDFSPWPTIQSIRHVKNTGTSGGYRSVFHMTDLRSAPEVNSE